MVIEGGGISNLIVKEKSVSTFLTSNIEGDGKSRLDGTNKGADFVFIMG